MMAVREFVVVNNNTGSTLAENIVIASLNN